METEKKTRRANFPNTERQYLIHLTNKYKQILESKKTDGITWRQKVDTWKKVENLYNSATSGLPRTAKQLKFKYDSIKKELRKHHSQHNMYVKGTGGGQYVPPPTPSTEEEKELAETIAISIQGLENSCDSDGIAGIAGIQIEQSENQDIVEEISIQTDWSNYSASMYQTPVHPLLSPPGPSSTSTPCTTTSLRNNENIDTNNTVITDHPYTTTPEKIDKRASHSRRPLIKKKKCISSAGSKFESLAEKKRELIEYQKQIAEEQLKQNAKEHEMRMVNLGLERVEHELRIQLLQKELACFESTNNPIPE